MVLQSGRYTIAGAAGSFLLFPGLPGNPSMATAVHHSDHTVTVTKSPGGFTLEVGGKAGQVPMGLYSATQNAEDEVGANYSNRTLFQVFVDAGGAANTFTIRAVNGLVLERAGNNILFRALAAGNANQIWTFNPVH